MNRRVAAVHRLAGPASQLDVGEAHRRVATVQRRTDDERRQQRADEPAPPGDAVAWVAALRVGQDRRLARLDDAVVAVDQLGGDAQVVAAARVVQLVDEREHERRGEPADVRRACRLVLVEQPVADGVDLPPVLDHDRPQQTPTRSPKWYCNDVVLRWPASRLISRSDTPSMPRQANSRSAAAINDVARRRPGR